MGWSHEVIDVAYPQSSEEMETVHMIREGEERGWMDVSSTTGTSMSRRSSFRKQTYESHI